MCYREKEGNEDMKKHFLITVDSRSMALKLEWHDCLEESTVWELLGEALRMKNDIEYHRSECVNRSGSSWYLGDGRYFPVDPDWK